MNVQQFNKLSADLRLLASNIPLHWGGVQNNRVDDQINMFGIQSYEELEKAISALDDYSKNYLRRRWYLWKCAECDEYLFYSNPNVEKNPDRYDKEWDIRIDGRYKFDVKGTVIPRDMRDNWEEVVEHPEAMIDFFYDRQSTGRRYDIQNRLFIVHHSICDERREFYLRCAWGSKKNVYERFIQNIDNIHFYKTHNVISGVIFILEPQLKNVECRIMGL